MKKFYATFILVFLALMTSKLFSQRDCHTMNYLQQMQAKRPAILQQMQRIESHTRNFEKSPLLRSERTITIPVVFHVLFNTTSEKISEEVLRSQIDVLNEDFQRLNADQTNQWSQAANVNIEFRLATVAPDGSQTNGIIHKFTDKAFFQSNNDMKFNERGGSDAWPMEDYLNIWVCDLFGNKLGYAQFPGGGMPETDGVVVDYLVVGRTYNSPHFGLGRTTTHEVGHWLNLRHIWGDGDCDRDDFVEDTPRSNFPTFGCQHGKTTCGSLDMTANFMDYSDDQCMNLFTEGQKVRMRALFIPGGFRASILNSSGLAQEQEATGEIVEDDQCPDGQNCKEEEEEKPQLTLACAASTQLKASFENRQLNLSWVGSAQSYIFELQLPNSSRWYAFSTQKNQLSISGVTEAMLGAARLKAKCSDGSSSDYAYFEISTNGRFASTITSTELKAYPNPARSELFLEWHSANVHFDGKIFQEINSDNSKSGAIELYDRSGRLLMQQVLDRDQNNTVLQVADLSTGLYFVIHRDHDGQIKGSQKVQVL